MRAFGLVTEGGRMPHVHNKIRKSLPSGNKWQTQQYISYYEIYLLPQVHGREAHTKKDTAYHMKKERNNGRKGIK
jgi:hypothetical protein